LTDESRQGRAERRAVSRFHQALLHYLKRGAKIVINAEASEWIDDAKAGHIIRIQGARMSFDPEDPELGGFLVAIDGTKHWMTVYGRVGLTPDPFTVRS